MVGDDQRSGLERADVAKTEIGQRHALAGRAEERTMLGDAKRPKAMWIAHDHQLAVGRDQDDVERAVEPFRNSPEHPDPVRLLVFGLELVGQRMHDDFGVGVALQVVVALVEQLFLELFVIGELAVEGERKPLRLAAVVAFERLGVGSVVAAAGGIAHVADRDRPVHLRS